MAIKYMDVGEFIDLGLLQEVNRQFLHPLGLALTVSSEVDDETGEPTGPWEIAGVWDAREDPEGIIFSDGVLSAEKAASVQKMMGEKSKARMESLGFVIQPVGK